MSGIYIHIPFCKQACNYCNFHFSTSLRSKNDMVAALCKEISLRKDYLDSASIDSIYFGGGTPSLLDEKDLDKIFNTLSKYFIWNDKAEITLEVNPDDINTDKLIAFKKNNINRLSIGVQSFFDDDLRWMNRAHSALEAHDCIKLSQDKGFDNISIDLIYGSPTTSNSMWKENIQKTLKCGVHHISSYCLTVEEKTVLHHQIKTKKATAPDPDKAAGQFDILIETLTSVGYMHYEISNFGLPGHFAVHNTNYWKGSDYLGIGPSAHSFNGHSRSWNIAHNNKYIESLLSDTIPEETELLSESSQYNEYILTGLRTMWGVSYHRILNLGLQFATHFISLIQDEIQNGNIDQCNEIYTLTKRGKHFADRIAMNLFYVD